MIINPTLEQQVLYKLLLQVNEIVVQNLKVGTKISEVYNQAYQKVVSEKGEQWAQDHLSPSFGHGTGFKHHEQLLRITKDNHRAIEKGNVFFVHLYFKNLKAESKTYALIIGDTYTIRPNPTNVTLSLPKEYKDISYKLSDEEDNGEESDQEEEKEHHKTIKAENIITGRRTRHEQVKEEGEKDEKDLIAHQNQLLEKKLEEQKKRFKNGEIQQTEAKGTMMDLKELKTYKSEKHFLDLEPTPGKIFVDNNNYAVLLPVFDGKWMPIHISLIKTVVSNTEGNWHNLRLNLVIPGANQVANNMLFPALQNENPIFIRDLSFKSTDQKYMESIKKEIQELSKKFKVKDKER